MRRGMTTASSMSSQAGSALGALDARSASVLGGQLVDRTPAKRAEFRDRSVWAGLVKQRRSSSKVPANARVANVPAYVDAKR